MNQKLPEIQNAVFRVARLVFCDGEPRTRKAIDYFICAACDAPRTFDYDATAFLKDETVYDNKTIVDALINVGFRMFLEPMNLAEIRAAVQKELDNGKSESRPADASQKVVGGTSRRGDERVREKSRVRTR